MTEVEFIASEIRENRIEYARLKKELKEAIDEKHMKMLDFQIVKVQKMFPNCQKYEKCCNDEA